MDHVISGDESETIEIQKTGELAELFGRANTEGIHMAIQGLQTKYNGEFDASDSTRSSQWRPIGPSHRQLP
jgi:hypothetical protein